MSTFLPRTLVAAASALIVCNARAEFTAELLPVNPYSEVVVSGISQSAIVGSGEAQAQLLDAGSGRFISLSENSGVGDAISIGDGIRLAFAAHLRGSTRLPGRVSAPT